MNGRWPITGYTIGAVVLILVVIWHLSVGAKPLSFSVVISAFWQFDPSSFDHVIVRDLRLPRALIALSVGAALAVAGALMQGVTRNPLADPGLLGLMAGAALAAVISVSVFNLSVHFWLPWVAALGALLSGLVVWLVATRAPGGATPLTLTLAGAALSSLMFALITILNLLDQATFESLRGWLVGSIGGRSLSEFTQVLPVMSLGLIASLILAPSVTTLAMGDEQAAGLGLNVVRLKVLLLLCVVVLTATSVALAGPLGFVGLVIPHVVRMFVGADYRWVVPYCALFGAIYLVGVDVVARLILRPQEIATGLITALVGAPILIYLVRTRVN